jgi:hypothetical protein
MDALSDGWQTARRQTAQGATLHEAARDQVLLELARRWNRLLSSASEAVAWTDHRI